jgi:hypothetical protein
MEPGRAANHRKEAIMEAGMGTIWAWLFLAGTAGLFGWGFWMGLKGLASSHQPWLEYGHLPGGPGSYDVRYSVEKSALDRAA